MLKLSNWEKPFFGEPVFWVDNIDELIGLETKRSQNGNVIAAKLQGKHITAPEADQMLTTIALLDETKTEITIYGNQSKLISNDEIEALIRKELERNKQE